ncbi:MAG: GHKL domain-containing protein, partial [Cloacibacillus sp.]
YIGGIIKETEVGNIKRWCANYTLNAILSIYAERAEKLGIKVEVEASVPAELKIDEMELASIYANTIENAAEGCAAVAAGTNRWIKIFTAYEGGRLILQVRNSCAPNTVKFDEMGMPISSKVGGGTGTRSIRYVVEKHGGTWFFEEKEGVFSTSVVIAGA